MKKKLAVLLATMMVAGLGLAACGNKDQGTPDTQGSTAGTEAKTEAAADNNSEADTTGSLDGNIYVLTREDGSGTRGAFIELFGIEQKNDAGEKVDMTVQTAEITNSTSVMMTTIAGNEKSIGYVSLGSLDEKQVKALQVDGVDATAENVKDGSYSVARPFNIVTRTGDVSDAAQDFINFIMSEKGQKVVEDNGYVSVGDAPAYEAADVSGTVSVGGSSSVTPVMEKLKEAYAAANPNVEVSVQQSDSSTGVTSTVEGIFDIGMASRELKDSETEQGVEGTVIAMDGIAVIVNPANPLTNITSDEVLGIYTGELTKWDEIGK